MPLASNILRTYYSRFTAKAFLCLAMLFLAGITYFSIYYYTTGYDTLQHWFYLLNGCFYNRETWAAKFFTPDVKTKGDKVAAMGAVLAISIAAYIGFRWKAIVKRHVATGARPAATEGWQWVIAVIALALVAGLCSWALMRPAYDEIFSAVNCAQLHPFQTIAYYMLPNNHMYFNFLNNILFRWWWGDQVQSGRFISLLAYVGTMVIAYQWLQRLIGNRLYAFIALLPVALQFTVFAMAAQGRGYSAELFCGWASFAAMMAFVQQPDAKALRVNAIFTIFGFILVPAYLTIYISQGIVFVAAMASSRKLHWQYFKYQLIAGAVIFLFYVPGFCFSGVAAFTDNPYVKPACSGWMEFLPRFAETFRYFINYCFSMLFGEDKAINFVLFFLPLALYFAKQRPRRLVAFSYTILWLTYIVVTVYLRLNPFNRNMIIHYSLTMGCVLYTFYVLVSEAASLLKQPGLRLYAAGLLFGAPVLSYSTYLAISDRSDVSFFLYYNDVNAIYQNHITELALIPKESTIGFSYETFYMYYYFSKYHYKAVKCADGTEDYYVKRSGEAFPEGKASTYTKIKDGYEDYEFYKRK